LENPNFYSARKKQTNSEYFQSLFYILLYFKMYPDVKSNNSSQNILNIKNGQRTNSVFIYLLFSNNIVSRLTSAIKIQNSKSRHLDHRPAGVERQARVGIESIARLGVQRFKTLARWREACRPPMVRARQGQWEGSIVWIHATSTSAGFGCGDHLEEFEVQRQRLHVGAAYGLTEWIFIYRDCLSCSTVPSDRFAYIGWRDEHRGQNEVFFWRLLLLLLLRLLLLSGQWWTGMPETILPC